MTLIDQIKDKAGKDIKTIVLPETEDQRTIEAAVMAAQQGFAKIILLGNPSDLKAEYPECDMDGISIVDPETYDTMGSYVTKLMEIRKGKGLTHEKAEALLRTPMYFGVMMVKAGDADGMVAGAANATSDVLRPALQIIKTSKTAKIVSSIHIMCMQNDTFGHDGIVLFADTALNENPDADALSEIAIASADTYEQLVGVEPKVAMLSYSTHGSAKSPLVDKVIEATRLAKEKAPHRMIDGELQLDAALIDSIGKKKAPESTVAGQANVLVFPDLNSGNIGYKMAERLSGAVALGAITQGLDLPVNDMSRGCSSEDLAGVIAVTAVQAQSKGA